MFERLEAAVANCLAELGAAEARFELKPARDTLHGDLALNAAFLVAKELRKSPRDVAQTLASALTCQDGVAAASVAGGGFVNIQLDERFMLGCAAAMTGFQPVAGAARAVICADPGDLRQKWTAQALARLGEGDVIWSGRAADGWEGLLSPLVGEGSAFGSATEQERSVMARDLGRIWAAKGVSSEICFITTRGGSFRPGLYEAALAGQGGALTCVALGPSHIALGPDDDAEDIARLAVLSQRGDRALDLSAEALRRPDASNPAFLISYAYALLRRIPERSASMPLSALERRMLCELCRFDSLARLAHRLCEPYRLGIYLAEISMILLAIKDEAQKRGEKAIAGQIIHAAMIVFSQSFAILGVRPRDEIT